MKKALLLIILGCGCVLAQNTSGHGSNSAPDKVQGTGPAGSPPSGNPVLVSGTDGTNARTLFTDQSGRLVTANSTNLTDGTANNLTGLIPNNATGLSHLAIRPEIFNGVTWDRQFSCTNRAAISTTTTGTAQIIAAVSGQTIRICDISLSAASSVNITLVAGTGTDCATSPTNLSGAYQNVTSLVLEPGPQSAIRLPTATAFCLTQSADTAIGGMVLYAVY